MGDTITGLDATWMTFADDGPFAFEEDRYGTPGWILREQHMTA